MSTTLEVARSYVARGWNPLPLPHKQKKPVDVGWQTRTITAADVDRHFNSKPMNIGIVLGPSSHGLVDLDLDCEEAIAIAPAVLPPTKAIFGRASARGSHRLYYHPTLAATIDKATLQLKDPTTDGMLLEVRGRVGGGDKGAQSVFPGSTHETGEPITWEESGEPALAGDDLVQRAKHTAALCLLGAVLAEEGTGWAWVPRHDAALHAIGGFLARCGLALAMVKLYTELVAGAARDEEAPIVRAAGNTTVAHQKGEKTRGFRAEGDVRRQGRGKGGRLDRLRRGAGRRLGGHRGPGRAHHRGALCLEGCGEPHATAMALRSPPGAQIRDRHGTPGGIGKSSLEITEVMAMVSGKPLHGIKPPEALRVWLWNLEDPREETERHIQATAKLFGLTPDDIGDRLFVNCARETPLVIATTMRDKAVIVRPVIDSLVAEIIRNR